MKCVQKSCQRNKNLLENGYCNVCNEAVQETTTKELEKNNKFKGIKQVDTQELLKIYENVKKGNLIDQTTMSLSIIGGLFKIIDHQEASEKELEAKINKLEVENISNKSRIESLETWINRRDEAIKDMDSKLRKVPQDKDIEALKEHVDRLEGSLETGVVVRNDIAKHCNLCDEKFGKNCELEKHMNTEHKAPKEFSCNICSKTFHLKWRLVKHQDIHGENQSLKYCHYFNNEKVCPFEEIGCKFLHTKSSKCRFVKCKNKLCPFSHADEDKTKPDVVEVQEEELEYLDDMIVEEEVENVTDEEIEEIGENDCHLCSAKFESLEPLCEHLQTEHVEYHQGVLRGLANIEA